MRVNVRLLRPATAPEQPGDTATFTCTRLGDLSAPLTVNDGVGGGSVNGTDYQALPGRVTFAAGGAGFGSGSSSLTGTPPRY